MPSSLKSQEAFYVYQHFAVSHHLCQYAQVVINLLFCMCRSHQPVHTEVCGGEEQRNY